MPTAKSKPKNSTKVAKPDNGENIMDQFNPQRPKREILPTSPRSKQDIFQCFRPKPGHCLDYRISQTIANLHAGRDTLINIKDTTASYVPAPVIVTAKPKKRTKLSHGGPPCWEFLDERWRKKQEVLQAIYKEDLKKLMKRRKKSDKKQGKKIMDDMLGMVGPDWFQELSPKQLSTVDNLAHCINKDIVDKTIINTQENVEQLGVHLLPNHRHIKRALRQCCGLPVEFLLVLYQLINPQRKSYSINDRLLLSAVVHLTMTSTLRELHVRIPSPPRSPRPAPEPKIVPKKVKYESPYLEPFTFQAEPRKFSGVYKNKHIQYPESPYFSYIPQLKMEAFLEGDTLEVNVYKVDEDDENLRQEMVAAQETYNKLFPCEEKPKLLKPTIFKDLCVPSQAINYIPSSPSPAESDAEIQRSTKLNNRDDPAKISRTSSGTSPAASTSTSGQKPPTSSITSLNLSDDAPDASNATDNKQDDTMDEIMNHPCKTVCKGGVEKFLAEKCPRYEQLKRQKHATYIISGTIKRHGRPVPIVQGVRDVQCDCYDLYQEKVQKYEFDQLTEKNVRKLNKNNLVYGIGGTALTSSGPAYIISSVQPQIDIAYLRKCIDNIKLIVNYQKEEKQTREAALKSYMRLKHMVKHVSQCKNDLTRVLIKSCSIGPNYEAEKECDCMQKYIDTLTKYEEYMKLKQARNKLALLKEKYIITGVVTDPEGPIYIISGVRKMPTLSSQKECMAFVKKYKQLESKIEPITLAEKKESDKSVCKIKEEMCRCREEFENLLKNRCQCDKCYEEERQKNATYVISGAAATPSGHVVPIKTGVFDKGCTCLNEYREKMAQFESYRQRINARIKMQEQKEKYIISGVANTPDGPVYNITGLRPIVHCLCEEAQRALEAEERQLAVMPKLPDEGNRYAIKGVKETDEGNVFVISEALKPKECSCMNMLKDFEREHFCCMEAYKEYKEQLEQDAEEYIKDLEVVQEGDVLLDTFKDYQQFDRYGAKPTMLEELEMLGDLHEEDSSKTDKDEKAIAEDMAQCSCNDANTMNNDFLEELDKELSSVKDDIQTENEVEDNAEKSVKSQKLDDETSMKKTLKSDEEKSMDKIVEEKSDTKIAENEKPAKEPPEELAGIVADKSAEERSEKSAKSKTSKKKLQEKPSKTLKKSKSEYKMFEFNRFIILEKLPKNYQRQLSILQKMLKGMAKDGFPLAKLPDCHKLPHFKLWFQLRSGIYWTQESRMGFFYKMMELWNFTDRMKIQFKTPDLPLTKKQIASATFNEAELYKQIAIVEKDKFYRTIKQSTIDIARAFFPSLFTYEFPNKNFRETFFTYVPAKELQVLPYRLVQLHEMLPIPKAMRLRCPIP